MQLTQWNPFREMEDLMTRLSRGIARPQGSDLAEWAPVVDITENEREYLVKAELPGLKKEDIKLDLANGMLTLSGERSSEKENKGEKYHRIERSYGRFSRSFSVPDDVKVDQIKAECKDGVVSVHLPRAEAKPAAAKSITVE
ncbi:heat-shock protein Hsp20 [Solimonas fluminis]|uniref:Heat-shock protein Hsp20 n=1 Tax=Solimonas fluminis TaxID=2086571 RepID=A0A2S5TEF3_9GAMM|nr:Hsp20/alpha crystallin family protein [Solimonas fluminis]PPE73374.1 heat-shock protein Hsp20 [Solimonas fluminis]